jgi:N-methylhydantoinase A
MVSPGAKTYRVGVDIGGTFTDVVVVDERDGSVGITKVPTVPADPSEGFLNGLMQAFDTFGIDPAAIGFAVHGTTIATNTIIQGKGAKAALITSDGFSDVLEIAYQTRPTLYDIGYEKPAPLVPRWLTAGVPERIGPDGAVLVPLDEAAVAEAVERLVAAGAEAIVIAFLHAYRDPTHERRAAAVAAKAAPGVPIVLSSEVCPEYREYPRTSTAVVNAVLVPRIEPYVTRLEERLSGMELGADLHLMTSSGGIMRSGTAKRMPVHLVESGPAAGVIGAAFVAERLAERKLASRILSLDIGGTTAKASLVDDGMPSLADEFEVGAAAVPTATAGRGQGYPVKLPVINLVEIGAGGGSIASIDPGGALTVGPESAGAAPGPACYGKGGDRATITDAHLVLGRLNPGFLLGGALPLYPELARGAIERDIAGPLGLELAAAARAIIDIANARMIAALQLISIKRGIDPRDYVLVPSGGAGPLHAMAIAAALGVRTVAVPPTPGLNSALGLLATDVKHEIVRSVFGRTLEMDPDGFATILREMTEHGRRLLLEDRVPEGRVHIVGEADVCYYGQNYPLRIPLPDAESPLAGLDEAFRAEHRRRYGFASDTEPTLVQNIRLTAVGRVERPKIKPLPAGGSEVSAAVKGRRPVIFDAGPVDCPVYDRDLLLAGQGIVGPAIVEQMDSTFVLPSGARARVDASASLVATFDSET